MKGTKSFRNKKQTLKTARGRTTSSQGWLNRHLNDPYVARAKQEGYVSRAAFKLEHIDDKYKIFQRAEVIVDLGCAPGGWLQVCVKRAKKAKSIIGIDLQDILPVAGTVAIVGDIHSDETVTKLEGLLNGKKADLVLSDMAASSTGHKETDHLRNMALIDSALDFAIKNTNPGGIFIAKMLRGFEEKALLLRIQKYFKKTSQFKPEASYADSSEIFLIATGFRD
jgi:23S rRNA (uridine2552-2'-O)-methyltransferase